MDRSSATFARRRPHVTPRLTRPSTSDARTSLQFNYINPQTEYGAGLTAAENSGVSVSRYVHTPPVRFVLKAAGFRSVVQLYQQQIQQEAFEKCWAHSPLRAAARRIAIHQVSLLSHDATLARRLRLDVHDDANDNTDNDNA